MRNAFARFGFKGVLEIFRYNWPQYVFGSAVSAIALMAGVYLMRSEPWMMAAVLLVSGGVAALWFVLASLAASWWIYDLSGLRDWDWLHGLTGISSPWALVHTGLDECGYLFRNQLAPAQGVVFDTYDEHTMTEPSVRRARAYTSRQRRADAKCKWDAWPVSTAGLDRIYFIFSAHELRASSQRLALFREAARSLSPGGRLIVVEHVRDCWNFLVFGPGFVHFWPARVWDEAATAAALKPIYNGRKTPFITVRIYERMPDAY